MPTRSINNIPHGDMESPSYQFNELDERLIGIPALNPFFRSVSGPRAAMFNKHVSQRPTISQPSSQRLQTGVGYELGKYTYKLQIPEGSYVTARIPKYGTSLISSSQFKNPLSTVIFVNDETQEVDCIDLVRFHSQHQYFGFEYKYDKDILDDIHKGKRTYVNTVVADSPSKAPDGDYQFGIHANIALTSDPVVIEDGIKISESFAEKLKFSLFESRTVIFSNDTIGLNIYGDDDVYKMFPNIGDRIRDDGILFSLRDHDDEMAPADLSMSSLKYPTMFDTSTFGQPGAEVIDIEIIKGDVSRTELLTGMQEQLQHHHNAQVRYSRAIYDEYKRLMKESRGTLRLSHKFNTLVKDAYAIISADINKLSYRSRDKLNGWTVKIIYKYELTPKLAFKLTDLMGGKGVVCEVVSDEQMPINDIGIRADVVMDNQSLYKRTIMGKHHEIYINATIDKLMWDLRQLVVEGDKSTYLTAFNYVLGFYKIVSPPMYDLILANEFDGIKHVEELLKGNIGLWLPANNPVDYMEVIQLLEKHYPAINGKVKFSGTDGKMKTSKSNILIGGCYMILLDKIATESAAVASAKTQHFGIPSKLNKTNKYHSPARDQPTKTIAEDESRVLESIVGGKMTVDLLDQTNNPDVHKTILNNIYRSDKPSGIYRLVDRTKQPTGHGYIQNMVNNVLNCAGLEFTPTVGDE